MADVYANAYLTIAATRASHCGEGFLQARIAKDQQIFEFADDEGSVELNASYDDLIIAPGSMDAVIDDELDMRKVSRTPREVVNVIILSQRYRMGHCWAASGAIRNEYSPHVRCTTPLNGWCGNAQSV